MWRRSDRFTGSRPTCAITGPIVSGEGGEHPLAACASNRAGIGEVKSGIRFEDQLEPG